MLLSLVILLTLAVFLLTIYSDTRMLLNRQVESHLSSLAGRFEKELSTYLDLVEENFLTIRSNESLVSRFYQGEEGQFLKALEAWEEDYERTRYDFLAVRFPDQNACFLFSGYFTGLETLSCQALMKASGGLDSQGWKVIQQQGSALGVFSTPLYLNHSGKLIGQLVGGVRLTDNKFLLSRLVGPGDSVRRIDILHHNSVLSSMRFDGEAQQTLAAVDHYAPVRSSGDTVFGPELRLQITSSDPSVRQLRTRLIETFMYGGLVTIGSIFLLSLLVSRALDGQLQTLVDTVRKAYSGELKKEPRPTHIREFNDLGQQIIAMVAELQAQKALLRRNNDDKRRILQHLIQTEEKERLRLSNDLHDDIGQLLAALKTNLHFIRDEHGGLAHDSRSLKTSLDIVNLMYDAIYYRIGLLRASEEMQHFGLAGSLPLMTIIPQLENLDYAVELDIQQARPLRLEVMTNLYRIAQEAMTNVFKYASGTWVLLRLVDEAQGVRLRVQDDGVGFCKPTKKAGPEECNERKDSGGFGLIGMRERAEQLDGELSIYEDEGVVVDIFVPGDKAWSITHDAPCPEQPQSQSSQRVL
ncbi:MAG: histidine kinase [Marinobacterium sp.]|nr:histidine kinase [Marinobacterium sp.]